MRFSLAGQERTSQKSHHTVMEMESAETDYGISYEKAAEYWSDIPPTIDGMLGGFAKISGTDIDGSSKFLKGLFRLDDAPGNARCLDCGAGIGRISKHLLQRHFSTVDLVEQNPKFLEQVGNQYSDMRSDLSQITLLQVLKWLQALPSPHVICQLS